MMMVEVLSVADAVLMKSVHLMMVRLCLPLSQDDLVVAAMDLLTEEH